MTSQLKILILATECTPFVKTGGMADVVGELPRALHELGHDVRVALPRYRVIPETNRRAVANPFPVPLDDAHEQAGVLEGRLGDDVPIYFIENGKYFDREGIYMYPDDAERFIFFSRAVVEMCKQLDWQPDVLHAHDWQTGFVPNWLKTIYAHDPFFEKTATVFTIHNLAYQGIFGQRVLQIAGLDAYGFIAHPNAAPEINQVVDFLARGILFADALNTVSERYAREIQTPESGERLDPILREKSDRLRGILNGIDYGLHNPATDAHLVRTFDVNSLDMRIENKRALQRETGLAENDRAPIVAMVSRLNDSKGFDLVADVIDHILDLNVQFVLMGTGDAHYHQVFGDLARRDPKGVATFFTFNERIERRILASADVLLMPSRVEPSGTTQLVAMHYGCVPVVRATGGLADSVENYQPEKPTGVGFTFEKYDRWALFAALARAIETYRRPDEWRELQRRGMTRDFSWRASAEKYADLYRFAMAKKLESVQQRLALVRELERTAQILATIPEPLRRLSELAYNLWWTWHPDAEKLFEDVDSALWQAVIHNPVALLRQVEHARLETLSKDTNFLAHYDRVMRALDDYLTAPTTWFGATYPYAEKRTLAYFSAEYGLHESLPIYSGGLGVLAGDHCKEASDLGLPFVAVGFLYPQGYFRQQIDAEGNQIAIYDKINLASVPAFPAQDANGGEVKIPVGLPGRSVYAQVWRVQVGRVPVYLLDTDIEENLPADRELSYRLYGGDRELRISQEFVLGIGGIRALRAMGLKPDAFHMNEGHCAFLTLELAREQCAQGRSFANAIEFVRAHTLFTTHTSVPAGHDVFDAGLVEKYFASYWNRLGLTREQFLDLGRHDDLFSMTVLALKMSNYRNGVSKIHSGVARQMWHWLWHDRPLDLVPIDSITNGIHTATWTSSEWMDFYTRTLGADWYEHLDERAYWEKIPRAMDQEFWTIHQARKEKLVEYVRRRIVERLKRLNASSDEVAKAERALDPSALTIGFARRVPTYKRATLIFHDGERLKRILNQPDRPVQFIFAGKAHPADEPGKALIRQVVQHSQETGFEGKIFYVEEYDMDFASYLVSGVDVWMNNPLPPLEASGTSGQKAAANGVLNMSVSDGWWAEAFNEKNGWLIGSPDNRFVSQQVRDEGDAQALYYVLEQLVIPLYYQRGADGLPHAWIARMKDSIRTIVHAFSARRMVKDYVARYVRAMVDDPVQSKVNLPGRL